MKRILGMSLAVIAFCGLSLSQVASAPAVLLLPTCLQDQYGNQYQNLVTDSVHNVVTGTVNNVQCTAVPWTMVGSWATDTNGNIVLELSVANNNSAAGCVPIYKLKGKFPLASWYYYTGFGQQRFQWTTCSSGSPAVPDTGIGGAHGLK